MIRHKTFGDFVDKKKRESLRQLKILGSLLEKNGLRVERFLEDNNDGDPYIFCFGPTRNTSFDGIRIYRIGDLLAFRVQKENKTHPYGSAYPIPVEEMFHDFMSDEGVDEKKAAIMVIESVGKEVKKFFDKAIEAERDDRRYSMDKDGQGNVAISSSGTDYSAQVYNRS